MTTPIPIVCDFCGPVVVMVEDIFADLSPELAALAIAPLVKEIHEEVHRSHEPSRLAPR